MTDGIVRTLRVRGPGADRLATVAARSLGAALERALGDLDDFAMGRLEVALPVDPSDYDDETLAELWAGAIRAGLLSSGAAPAARGNQPTRSAEPVRDAEADARAALRAARGWIARREETTVPAAALALARPDVAAAAAHQADPAAVAAIVAALEAALLSGGTYPAPTADANPGSDEAPRHQAPEHPSAAVRRPSAPSVSPARVPRDVLNGRSGQTPSADHRAALEDFAPTGLAVLAEVAGLAGLSRVDPSLVTDAAGLALLYPWLADHCRAAVAAMPGPEEAAARRRALAALVDPDDGRLVRDPFVRLLAGLPPDAPEWRTADAPGAADESLRRLADETLRGFVALLPGFAASSPAYVRREWIRRMGLLELQGDQVALFATAHPLDVLLSRLPYPTSLFALPWSPPVSVRFLP